MKIFFIGDVFGEAGRLAIKLRLPELRVQHGIDFVVANIENAAHGKGLTPKIIDELKGYGVQAFTAGNHIWDAKEILPYIKSSKCLVRPANYLASAPGTGSLCFDVYSGIRVVVISVQGQLMIGQPVDSPFVAVDRELEKWRGKAEIFLVDVHAEASSEKRAMGWYLSGRVAAVVGTHTHVQTADEEILPGGTAYLTDLGMTGPYDSVIGMNREMAVRKFVTQISEHLKPATGDPRLCGALIAIEESTGKAQSIVRIQEKMS
jgi:metallophosphoesterase (TIGR00282 family)